MLRGTFSTNHWSSPDVSVMGEQVVSLMLNRYDLVVDEQAPVKATANDMLECQLSSHSKSLLYVFDQLFKEAGLQRKFIGASESILKVNAPFERIRPLLEGYGIELIKYEANMVHELQTA